MNRETMNDDYSVTVKVPKGLYERYKSICHSLGIRRNGDKKPLEHNSEIFIEAITEFMDEIIKRRRR